ncbi:hypothetical protein F0562_011073 [Nyssa sinensis]|uniref:Disease resistance protein At4g27190-like leucine-rich repeats domain-containing protein n=1 Tax=Nyssa sinensis TaxID=561372 RepID=A0A5J5A2H0_9ASTE|nr:hypothetical protein F0562_011073 [Nyssa sinensis]
MRLMRLPNLRSFYPKSLKSSTKEGSPSSSIPAQPLFNEKDAFPSLESFTIGRLDSIKEILGNQSESFSQLRWLGVFYCDNLRNVFSPSIVKNLVHLQEVQISECPNMEGIVAIGETTRRNGQEGEPNDEIITFPQLKTLELRDLPNLKSFCSSRFKKKDEETTKDKDILQAQPFFNHKDAFPSLESFTIGRLGSIKEIWDNQSKSFNQLRRLDVNDCKNLRNVFPPSIVKNLEHLQEVEINECLKMEEIVTTGETTRRSGQEGEPNDEIITFPQLKTLKLRRLPNLKSFYSSRFKKEDKETTKDKDILQAQPFFNHKVAFPSLECFTIGRLDSIKDIWGNQSESFNQLRWLGVFYCDNLGSVFSPSIVKNLVHLQEVQISECPNMEGIVAIGETTRRNGQDGEPNDEIITFPQLKTLELRDLPNLKSFCSSRFKKKDEATTKDKDILQAQPFFNCKDAFPSLESFTISRLGSIKEIWDNQSESFNQLRWLDVNDCENLRNVFPSSIVKNLVLLQEVGISECPNMEGIVATGETTRKSGQEGEPHDEIITFPQLKTLELQRLPNLKSFCSSRLKKEDEETEKDNDILQAQPFFNHKVAFPSLESFTIRSLDSILEIWDNQSESFSQVRTLNVEGCYNLRNVFSLSIVKNLVLLQEVKISRCPEMEEILATGETTKKNGQEGESDNAIITFPQLKTLELFNLRNLKCFCSSRFKKEDKEIVKDKDILQAQPFFNHKVTFPSLERFTIQSLDSIIEIWDNQSESFSQLRTLYVRSCYNLRNVFSLSIVKNLVFLQEVEISECPKMEEILATGESDNAIITFPQLKTLKLESLRNLKCFCNSRSKKEDEEIVKDKDILQAQPLFNHKVAFLSLESFTIIRLDSILEIWDNQSESFSQLRTLKVSYCDNLRNLFSLSIVKNLMLLQKVEISKCPKMEEILATGETTKKNGQEGESNNAIITFPQLKTLKLESLRNLKCFCNSRSKKEDEEIVKDKDILQAQPLFNHKVAFPSLESFTISSLGSIIEIWDNQSESFSQLRTLDVDTCYNLRNVFSPSIVKNLVLLQEVRISLCPKMEEILATGETTTKNGQEGESNIANITFPQLKTLKLEYLQNLKSFCNCRSKKEDEEIVKDKDIFQAQPLFNHKVAFPSLESFTIVRLDSTIEIWDNQSESFSQLRTLNVRYCDNLRNVFSLSNVKNLMLLQEVEIIGCPKIEEILATGETTKKHGQEGESNNAIITFPQLKTLKLESLRNLKCFCNSRSKKEDEEIVKDKDILPAQPLFNHKVAFPSLESFTIVRLDSIIEIWDNQSESFSQLRTLNVRYCDNLRNVFSLSNVKNLMLLQEVEIIGCPKIEEILATGETTKKHGQEGESNNAIITFPQLKTLKLVELPNLKSFCSSRFKKEDEEIVKDKDILPAQPFFNHKVGFPVLEELHLTHCDNVTIVFSANSLQRLQNLGKFGVENCNQMRVVFDLEGLNVGKQQVEVQLPLRELQLTKLPTLNCIWNKDPKGTVSFRSLNKVIIQKCGLLKSLCTSSVARTLEQLQLLVIISCTLMEEIVAKEESGEVTDEIIFPQLKFLILVNLRNLTCFCRENYAFNMPWLRRVELVNCPKMQTVTFGQLSMPNIKKYADENQWVRKKGLYRYIKQQIRKGKEALTLTDGNNDDISSADSDSRDNEYHSNITKVWSDDDDDNDDEEEEEEED